MELEAGGAADGVEVGGKDRKLDDLTVWAVHQDAVAALKVVLQLTEGGFLPSRIEDEVLTTGFRSDDAAELRRVVAFGNFNRRNHVIADDRVRIGIYTADQIVMPNELHTSADRQEHACI